MIFDEAINGRKIPENILERLELLEIPFFSLEERLELGHIVVARSVSREVREIFSILFRARFPVEKIIPVSFYGWDDELSMEENNTSCFNYRKIFKSNRISIHSFGLAVDINPAFNPYVAHDGSIHPKNSQYDRENPGTICAGSVVVRAFESRGWRWGGGWNPPDFQHFEKPLSRLGA